MIIKEIYIKSFGKFNNFSMKFKDGFNIIYGDNEAGKTTILNFIIMTLYGNTSRSKDILQNERQKYRPWHSKNMGGYLILRKNNVDYKIERIFNKTNSSDEIKIYEYITGKEVKLQSNQQPGEYFLGISVESFQKTLFISSETMIIDSDKKNDELSKKLINLVSSGEEDISKNQAINNLDNKIETFISKNGKKGKIVDIKENIDNLYLKIEKAKRDEKEKLNFKNQIDDLNKEKIKKENILKKITQVLHLLNEKNTALINKKDLEINLSNGNEILVLENDIMHLKNKKNKLENKNLLLEFTYLDFSIVLSIIIAIIAIFTYRHLLIFAIALVGVYIFNKYKKNASNNEMLKNVNAKIHSKTDKLIILQNKKREIKDEIFYIDKAIEELDAQIIKITGLNNEYSSKDIELIKEEIFNIQQKIIDINSTIKERYRGNKNLSTLENEIESTKKELDKINKEYMLLVKTRKYIIDSFKEFETGFSKILNKRTSALISKLTNDKYNKIFVDNSFNISIQDEITKNNRNWKYLSSGTIDQIYLALRIIISETILENSGDRIFLLDDILIRFDSIRALETIRLLKDLENDYSQILLFTCHKLKIFEEENLNIINLK